MEAVKQTALSVIFLGLISSLTGMICPDEQSEKYLKPIIGGILIIMTAKGLAGAVFSFGINENAPYVTESITENADDYFREAAGRNLSRTLEKMLREENIAAEISCEIDISESGGIYITKVTAVTEKASDSEKILRKVREAVGEDVTVYVKGTEE